MICLIQKYIILTQPKLFFQQKCFFANSKNHFFKDSEKLFNLKKESPLRNLF